MVRRARPARRLRGGSEDTSEGMKSEFKLCRKGWDIGRSGGRAGSSSATFSAF